MQRGIPTMARSGGNTVYLLVQRGDIKEIGYFEVVFVLNL